MDVQKSMNFINESDQDVSVVVDLKKVTNGEWIFTDLQLGLLYILRTLVICKQFPRQTPTFLHPTHFNVIKFWTTNEVPGFHYFEHRSWDD